MLFYLYALRDLPASFVQELMPSALLASESSGQTPRHLETVPAPTAAALHDHDVSAQLRQGSVADRLNAALEFAFPSKDMLPTVEDLERAGIRLAMRRLDHNMQLTALRLNISRATLYRRLDQTDAALPRRPGTL